MSQAIQSPCFLPDKGIVLNKPSEFLANMFSPYSRNMEFYNERCQGRSGLAKFSETALSGAVVAKATLVKFDSSRFDIFCTPKDIYSYDFGSSRFDILTPIYTTGKVKLVNGSAVIHGGLEVDNCDDAVVAWADGSGGDVTPSRQTTSPQDGTAFVRLTVAGTAGVELLAYHDITSIDLSGYDSIGFWIRSSVALSNGDLQFLVDNTAACASPLETINIPAISANTWTWVNLPFVDHSLLTAVVSIGIKQAVDKGAMTVDIDQIVAGDWLDQISVGDYFKLGSTGINTDATWYEILTVDSDTQITLTAAYAETSGTQQAYAIRQIFSGGNSDVWDWKQFLDASLGEVIVFTNGVDTPVYWDGSGQAVELSGLPTGFLTAKYVDVYKDRVVFLWTVEGGGNQPQRARSSDVANCLSWPDENFEDFVDEPTEITGSAVFSGYLIVFKQLEAYVGRFVGGDIIFEFERSSQCRGTKSAFSIVVRNDVIFYYGSDNKFHKWNLLQDDIISESIFPETKEFTPNVESTIQGFDVSRRNQVRWFCPYGDTEINNYVFVYDYQQSIPQVWVYESEQACASFGSYLATDDLYADDPIYGELYADETSTYADDISSLANSETLIYGGYDGYIRLGDSGLTDDGEEYQRLLRLNRLNFEMPNNFKRLQGQIWWLESDILGSVTIKIKLDDKTSYENQTKTISLIPEDVDQEFIKSKVTWDKEAQNFQPEISSYDHFATLGCVNYVYPKRGTKRF